ncbi:MAG: hypothetical protein PHY16_14240 [Methylobacter sp.]|nr:hypothetical protein [Methylobacter sp.]
MAGKLQKPSEFRSLSAHIRYTEQRLDEREQVLRLHTSALANKLRGEIRQPSTLLFGAGIGFIIGELTRSQQVQPKADKPKAAANTPTSLEQMLNFATLAQTVSTAWPLLLSSILSPTSQTTKATESEPDPYRQPSTDTVTPASSFTNTRARP